MDLRRDQLKRLACAPAKLNLFLEVLGRRADGFHELETLMVPIRLFDTLVMTALPASGGGRAGAIELEVISSMPHGTAQRQAHVPATADNLVVRALELLRQRTGCQLGARLKLVKRIPSAAGLGGGSSDAAAALRLANNLWGIHWPMCRLAAVAAEVGSDVPFFVAGGVAICRGRGDRVEPFRGWRPLHAVVVKPPENLSTADVYRAHDSLPSSAIQRLSADLLSHCGSWMHNRLEAAASSLSPWIERLRSAFSSLDVLRHQLSGSGSAYFGVCRSAQHARRMASILRTRKLGLVYATRSCA